MEIQGWTLRYDDKGSYLRYDPLFPHFYTVTLLGNLTLECSFLKSEIDPLPPNAKEQRILEKLKLAISQTLKESDQKL